MDERRLPLRLEACQPTSPRSEGPDFVLPNHDIPRGGSQNPHCSHGPRPGTGRNGL